MSTPILSKRQQNLARIAAASMADRRTPMISNAWYVAASGPEITRTPMARRMLGRSVVLFRDQAGNPVAMQNRCCHRSFPLSEGRLDGDTLVCRYHGLRYDFSGRCIEVPSQQRPPANIGVKSYPARERGPFVWAWLGDPELADTIPLPHQEWLDAPDWDRYYGYLHIKSSYVHMHENLLDLSHLSFLHDKTFGTPEYARAPIEPTLAEGHFEVWRHVECELPPIYSRPLGWSGDRAVRSSGAQYVAPGLHVNTGLFRNLSRPELNNGPQPTVRVAQLLTPETLDTTHYYYCLARNFARGDEAMTLFMKEAQFVAFSEDVYAMEHIREMQDTNDDADFYEVDVQVDRPGVEMRRHLKKLADAEQSRN